MFEKIDTLSFADLIKFVINLKNIHMKLNIDKRHSVVSGNVSSKLGNSLLWEAVILVYLRLPFTKIKNLITVGWVCAMNSTKCLTLFKHEEWQEYYLLIKAKTGLRKLPTLCLNTAQWCGCFTVLTSAVNSIDWITLPSWLLW